MGEAARQVFGFGQPGFVIVTLVVLGVGSWLGEMVTNAIGKGQISAMIRTGTQIAAILTVISVAWTLLTKFFDFTVARCSNG